MLSRTDIRLHLQLILRQNWYQLDRVEHANCSHIKDNFDLAPYNLHCHQRSLLH